MGQMGKIKSRMTLDMMTRLCSWSLSHPFINLAPSQGFKSNEVQLWKEAWKNELVLSKLGSHLLVSCRSKKVTWLSPESEYGATIKLQDKGYEYSGPLVQSTYLYKAFLTDSFNQSWSDQRSSTPTTHQLI